MVSQNLDQVFRAAQALSDEEREELRRLLDERSERNAMQRQISERWAKRRQWAAEMAKKGVSVTIPPEPTPEEWAKFLAWQPIEMPGGPLSDDIIRDRE